MIIRAKTFERWMNANFDKETMRDITEHGCVCGFPGLTYYKDTRKLYAKFSDDIWEILIAEAEDQGFDTVWQYLGNASDVGNGTQAENLLVWAAAEAIARMVVICES